jgi:hypothetical protein
VPRTWDRLLEKLETAKHLRPSHGRVERILEALHRRRFPDAESLIRYHEAALFLRAYPQTRGVLRRAEKALASIPGRVAALERAGEDLSALDTPEVSGIAGTAITTDYSYDVVEWLARRHRGRVGIDWEGFEGTDRLRFLWPRFLPLLEEEAAEDANVPYREWLRAGKPGAESDLAWLLERLRRWPLSDLDRAERFDALGLTVSWTLADFRSTRTGMRGPGRRVFVQDSPLLTRREVSLERELSGPPLAIERLSAREGARVLAMVRDATALRYREYYGFTYSDPRSVRRSRLGRGLQIFFCGLPVSRRLPLRGGFAGFLVKNGVPVGYVEALAFLERVEIGFNVYYTFRDGESAWIFSQVLKVLNQILGVTSFSIDPYQIGHENKEALDSGAFWFYRKLGFRSTDPGLRAMTVREEQKLARNPGYRTPPAVLKRLATHNVLFEPAALNSPFSALHSPLSISPWDLFHIRNLGLAVNRRMARDFGGDAQRMRRTVLRRVAGKLGARPRAWPESERRLFEDFALVLDLIRDLPRWSPAEKRNLLAVVRAKAGRDEVRYLRLMQRHDRLRDALLRLGTGR